MRYILCTLGLAVLGIVALPAQAQTTAPGPYYATPSWDQQLQCDTKATCPRFIVLSNWNNEAVLDRETGLVWQHTPDPNTALPWSSARVYCNALTRGKRMGWRLPMIEELASLIDPSVPYPGPTLPPGHPFSNVQSGAYWSASIVPDVGLNDAEAVLFNFGQLLGDDRSNSHFVWCVRGGKGDNPF